MPIWPKKIENFHHSGKSSEYIKKILHSYPEIINNLPPAIIIAGTNGKGSTTAFLRAMLQAANFSVHAYTSPHLLHYNERIVLNNAVITDKFAEQIFSDARQIFGNQKHTFFEAMTVAGFIAFSQRKADFLLLEVGMGGRYDPTNIVKEVIASIITSISFDHMAFLGNTIEEIAWQKAGIIRNKAPCIVAKQQFSSVNNVINQEAKLKDTTTFLYNKDWKIESYDHSQMIFSNKNYSHILDKPNLLGNHQMHNAGTAIQTILTLQQNNNLTIDWQNIENGLQNTKWPARLENITSSYLDKLLSNKKFNIWIDGAHNSDGARVLKEFINTNYPQENFYLIVGMTKDKNPNSPKVQDFLEPFTKCKNIKALLLTCVKAEYNAYTSQELYAKAQNKQFLEIIPIENLEESLYFIGQKFSAGHILICGSLYLYTDLMKLKKGQTL